jgi:hypothetical protein
VKYLIMSSCLVLAGCAACPEKEPEIRFVTKEVWTPPKFDKPERPILKDSAGVSDGQAVRNSSTNTLDLMKYSEELEKIVNSIK